jgi:hypothetical protein
VVGTEVEDLKPVQAVEAGEMKRLRRHSAGP